MSRIEAHPKKTLAKPMIIGGLIISILVVATSILLFFYPFPSNQYTEYFKTDHPIVFQGEVYQLPAIVNKDEVYVPVSFVKEKLDESITIDQKTNSIILTTKNKVLQLPSESLTYFVNMEPFTLESPAFTTDSGQDYMALEPFKSVFNIQLDFQSETGALLIKKGNDSILPAQVKEHDDIDLLRLREKPELSSSYVGEVTAKEALEIEKDEGSYYFVRKKNGIGGYIQKSMLILSKPQIVESLEKNEPIKINQIEWPINLTWEAIYTKTPNPSNLPKTNGVNVVSPTWFKLKNSNGDIQNLGTLEYSKWAKANNYQIWALFSNDFDPQKTHEAFQDFETRQKIIRQLLQYSQMYELDGINIDIENVNIKDGPLVTQFIREATPYFHQAGLIVSMDITFISSSENWSMFYEREKLKDIVDYLVVMAYDEHWASSPKSGSVASFPWVESNLEKLLAIVPHDRLILGIPLYARIWKEEVTTDGNISVSSQAFSMDKINDWIKDKKVTPTLDKESGQYYAEYYDKGENATYKIWIENDYSLKKRAQLVHKYSLAGIGSWARYFGNDTAWTALNQSLKTVELANKGK